MLATLAHRHLIAKQAQCFVRQDAARDRDRDEWGLRRDIGARNHDLIHLGRDLLHGRGKNKPTDPTPKDRAHAHHADLRKGQGYLDRHPLSVAAVEPSGIRTLIEVPMLKPNEVVGVISIIAARSARSPTSRSGWSRALPVNP